MAYKVIILYRLYMPSYFLGTFTEYPQLFIVIYLERMVQDTGMCLLVIKTVYIMYIIYIIQILLFSLVKLVLYLYV